MNKWGKQFWLDLAERVGTTAIGGGVTILTTDSALHYSTAAVVSVIAIPTAVSFLKGLLANLAVGNSGAPSASAVGVTSNQSPAATGATGEGQ